MAAQSLPANLKFMEGLLKNDSSNRQLLTALCMGYSGYALLFVEEESPKRASHLYLRAKEYGLRALNGTEAAALKHIRKDGVEPLFWTTMAWMSWINLNLDQPLALAQIRTAQTYLDRVLEIDPAFFYGAPHILMGAALAARPPMLGGDAARAKEHFEAAKEIAGGKFLLGPYYEAKYYAVRVQDKEHFTELLESIEGASPDELKEVCLINAVVKEKAERLHTRIDELFF
jgi:hypothetical protein